MNDPKSNGATPFGSPWPPEDNDRLSANPYDFHHLLGTNYSTSRHEPQTTITVWFLAIFAMSLEDIAVNRSDHLVGRPLDTKNCLTVDALMPKLVFSGIEPIAFGGVAAQGNVNSAGPWLPGNEKRRH